MKNSQLLLPIPEAYLGVTGQTIHSQTGHAYATRGIGGVRLRSWMVSNRRLTSLEAVRDFIAATNEFELPQNPSEQE